MTTNNEPHEIVRQLEDGDAERGFPCFVGNLAGGETAEPCERPVLMAVYGLAFCGVHGRECANGALEEMHQDAYEFFERLDNPHVPPLQNPLVLRAVRGWETTLREEDRFSAESAEDLLLAAFPFRKDRVWAETVAGIIDPPRDEDHPRDWLHRYRYELHQLMRHAYRLGLTFAVEHLEAQREPIAAQLSYAVALERGEVPEVLQRAAAD